MITFSIEKLKIEEEGSTLTLRIWGEGSGDPQYIKVPIPTYAAAKWADTVGASIYLDSAELVKNRHREDHPRSFKATLVENT